MKTILILSDIRWDLYNPVEPTLSDWFFFITAGIGGLVLAYKIINSQKPKQQ